MGYRSDELGVDTHRRRRQRLEAKIANVQTIILL